MEILTECNAPQAWMVILGVGIGIILGGLGAFWVCNESNTKENAGYVMVFLGLVALIFGVTFGIHGIPSYKKYTVEINDPRAYQYLIENNYHIEERPYDSKNIYVVTGDLLPDEWHIEWSEEK